MKFLSYSLFLTIGLAFFACDATPTEDGVDPTVRPSIDYEDGETIGGELEWKDQSARGESTTNTTNYADPADPESRRIKPEYTDNEYEPAFSTATTEPANIVDRKKQ